MKVTNPRVSGTQFQKYQHFVNSILLAISLTTFGRVFEDITHTTRSAQFVFSLYLCFLCPLTHSAHQCGVFWKLHPPPHGSGQTL